MTHVHVRIGATWHEDFVTSTIEGVMADLGFRQSMKGGLRTYPGCVHWHYKKGAATGTIEVTAWSVERRVWLSVQSGRTAPWIAGALPRIRAVLESRLASVEPSRE